MQKPPFRDLRAVRPVPSAQSAMAKQKAQAMALKKGGPKKAPPGDGEFPDAAEG